MARVDQYEIIKHRGPLKKDDDSPTNLFPVSVICIIELESELGSGLGYLVSDPKISDKP